MPSISNGKVERTIASADVRITAFKGVSAFLSWWEQSVPRALYLAFQDPRLMLVWERTLGLAMGAAPIVVRVDDAGGTPLLAVYLTIQKVGMLGVRTLSFMDADVCDYNAPILFEPLRRFEMSARELWRRIRLAVPNHDVVRLEKMSPTVQGAPNPLWLGADDAIGWTGHAMTLPSTWQQVVLEKGEHKIFKAATRNLRRLREQYPVRIVHADDAGSRENLFAALVAQKKRRFEETGVPDLFDTQPGYRAFYHSAAELTKAGIVHFSGLCVGDEFVATNLGFLDASAFYGVLTTFAKGPWERYSCGNVHLQLVIQWAIANGLATFDFGPGDGHYKLLWCDRHTPLSDLYETTSVKGHAREFLAGVRRALRPS
jgi:CelD/BcsL family acetyltransferase involved in cellulose biosynthesis